MIMENCISWLSKYPSHWHYLSHPQFDGDRHLCDLATGLLIEDGVHESNPGRTPTCFRFRRASLSQALWSLSNRGTCFWWVYVGRVMIRCRWQWYSLSGIRSRGLGTYRHMASTENHINRQKKRRKRVHNTAYWMHHWIIGKPSTSETDVFTHWVREVGELTQGQVKISTQNFQLINYIGWTADSWATKVNLNEIISHICVGLRNA